MYSYGAGSPGTYGGLGRPISVRIYDTMTERDAAQAAHLKELQEAEARGEDPLDQPTEKAKYEALDWNRFTLKQTPAAPAGFPWGTFGVAAGLAAGALVILRMTRKR